MKNSVLVILSIGLLVNAINIINVRVSYIQLEQRVEILESSK